jgi:hypothetical protein
MHRTWPRARMSRGATNIPLTNWKAPYLHALAI